MFYFCAISKQTFQKYSISVLFQSKLFKTMLNLLLNQNHLSKLVSHISNLQTFQQQKLLSNWAWPKQQLVFAKEKDKQSTFHIYMHQNINKHEPLFSNKKSTKSTKMIRLSWKHQKINKKIRQDCIREKVFCHCINRKLHFPYS